MSDLSNAMSGLIPTKELLFYQLLQIYTWTPGDADWDVGVPETSERQEVLKARKEHDKR